VSDTPLLTGHAEFQDRTNEGATAVNTEKEMKQLDADMKADLGLPDKKGKAAQAEAMDTVGLCTLNQVDP
jgi:hypothetical protein